MCTTVPVRGSVRTGTTWALGVGIVSLLLEIWGTHILRQSGSCSKMLVLRRFRLCASISLHEPFSMDRSAVVYYHATRDS